MNSIRLIFVAAVIQLTLFLAPFEASAQESVFDYSGAWVDTETQTLYVLFKDGNFLFTFINPPSEMSIPDWHIRGVWSPIGTNGIEIRYPFRLTEKEKYSQRTEKLRLKKGALISLLHGHVYVRVEKTKAKVGVKQYKELEE